MRRRRSAPGRPVPAGARSDGAAAARPGRGAGAVRPEQRLLELHRALGNRALERMLAGEAERGVAEQLEVLPDDGAAEAEARQAGEELARGESVSAARGAGAGRAAAGGAPPAAMQALGSGRALPPADRAYFEPRLGIDLSAVRVHHGEAAAGQARRLGAKAFTAGSHVVFGDGHHRPGSREGRRLMGHELAHVAQQASGSRLDGGGLGAGGSSAAGLGAAGLSAAGGGATAQCEPEEGTTAPAPKAATPKATAPQLTAPKLGGDRPGIEERLSLMGVPAPEVTTSGNTTIATVYFGQDQMFLDARGHAAVQRLARHLRSLESPTVSVDGHASTEGSDQHNQQLSMSRRELVVALLREGFPGELSFGGAAHGESNLAVPETGGGTALEGQRARNRRVEIVITGEPWQISPEGDEPPPVPPRLTPEDFRRVFPQENDPEVYGPRRQQPRIDPFDPRFDEALRQRRDRPRRSLNDLADEAINRGLDRLLRGVGVRDRGRREFLRDQLRGAIRSGVGELLDRTIDATGLGSEERDALKHGIRALGETDMLP